MIVFQAFRYELDPTRSQREVLARHAGTARFAYNWGLRDRIDRFKKNEGDAKFTKATEQHRKLVILKKTEFSWMRQVSKCAPQEALRDLDRAFNNFWRGRKARCRVGFPRFKRRGVRDSFRLQGPTIRTGGRFVVLPVLGKIRSKELTTKFSGRILSATISREADRWFVSFAVERERPDPAPIVGSVVGVDLGLTTFAVVATADGSEVERVTPQKPLANALRQLARAQRKHVRKIRGSINRRKSAMRIARIHRKVKNRRKDFLHKFTTRLARTKSVIVIEDLKVANLLKNRSVSRAILDAGWGEARRQLVYKTKWYGSRLVVADQFYPSSKICSSCGTVKATLSLKDREFVCEACGVVVDHDGNAGRNLAQLGSTGSSPGSDACAVETTAELAGRSAGRRPRGRNRTGLHHGLEKRKDLLCQPIEGDCS